MAVLHNIILGDLQRAKCILFTALWLFSTQLTHAENAGISGTITSHHNNTPLAGIRVEAFQTEDGPGGAALSDAAGAYHIYPLSSGTYIVRFFDPAQQYAPESYDQIPGHDFAYHDATVIELQEGVTQTNINASLRTGSILSGRVTQTNDTFSLPNILVEAFEVASSNLAAWTFSDHEGDFTLGGLAKGKYRIRLQDPEQLYAAQVYGAAPGVQVDEGGYDFELESASTWSNIVAELSLAGRLTGRVTGLLNAEAFPLSGIYVEALHLPTMTWGPWTYTDEEGRYALNGLIDGDYRVRFQDDTSLYWPRIYSSIPGKDLKNDGTAIPVQMGVTVSDINESLFIPATLAGQVTHGSDDTPVQGASIHIFILAEHNWEYRVSSSTDAEGHYSLSIGEFGEYIFFAEAPPTSNLLNLWYDNILFEPPQNSVIPLPAEIETVLLDGGTSISDADFHLPRASRIHGGVKGLATIPLEGAQIIAHNLDRSLNYHTSVAIDGHFVIDDLLPGTYHVKAIHDGFAAEWWSNRPHRTYADSIELVLEEDQEISFDLSPGQQLAGLQVESTPSGATIYIDHRSTGLVTPAVIDLGEVALNTSGLMPRSISVINADHIRSPVYEFYPFEAETPTLHFDLTQEAGSLHIDSDPPGATVFVNDANDAVGHTPVTVSNLIAHSVGHWIQLRKDGYLLPAPILATTHANETKTILIELTQDTGTGTMVDVRSLPPQADLYVNYLDTGTKTDQSVSGLDPAIHSGEGWTSASHSVQPQKEGYLLPLARKTDLSVTGGIITVSLLPDESFLGSFDDRDLTLFNLWAAAYGGTNEIGSINEDRFGKGLTNWEQMLAGLNPRDPTSRLAFPDSSALSQDATGIRLEWPSVSGRRYILQKTHGLHDPWQSITGLVSVTNTSVVVIDPFPAGPSNAFYRIQVIPPHL